jgi:hypothetical protein
VLVDPAGEFAYVAAHDLLGLRVTKVSLRTFEAVETLALRSFEGDVRGAAIDPDGRYAYLAVSDWASGSSVVKIDLTSFGWVDAWQPAGAQEKISAVFIAPDGSHLYVVHHDRQRAQLAKLSLDTFEAVAVGDSPTGPSPDWSPLGDRIVFTRFVESRRAEGEMTISTISPDGTGLKQFPRNRLEDEGNPSWSPDGTRIAFTRGAYHWNASSNARWVMNADGSGRRKLIDTKCFDMTPAWSPDGRQVAFYSDGSDPYTGRTAGIHVVNTDGKGLNRLPSDEGDEPAWQPVAAPRDPRILRWWKPRLSTFARLSTRYQMRCTNRCPSGRPSEVTKTVAASSHAAAARRSRPCWSRCSRKRSTAVGGSVTVLLPAAVFGSATVPVRRRVRWTRSIPSARSMSSQRRPRSSPSRSPVISARKISGPSRSASAEIMMRRTSSRVNAFGSGVGTRGVSTSLATFRPTRPHRSATPSARRTIEWM